MLRGRRGFLGRVSFGRAPFPAGEVLSPSMRGRVPTDPPPHLHRPTKCLPPPLPRQLHTHTH